MLREESQRESKRIFLISVKLNTCFSGLIGEAVTVTSSLVNEQFAYSGFSEF